MNKATSKTKTALVTGANRGIGLAIAKGLSANENIRVLAAARKTNDAETAVRDIGNGSIAVKIDLSVPEDAATQAKDIEADHGPIDILESRIIQKQSRPVQEKDQRVNYYSHNSNELSKKDHDN